MRCFNTKYLIFFVFLIFHFLKASKNTFSIGSIFITSFFTFNQKLHTRFELINCFISYFIIRRYSDDS